jgi:hypothetical protein
MEIRGLLSITTFLNIVKALTFVKPFMSHQNILTFHFRHQNIAGKQTLIMRAFEVI